MSVFVGPAMLKRLVAQKAGVPLAETERVLNAHTEVVLALLETGAKVRALGQGYFVMKESRKINKFIPATGEMKEIPAKRSLAFRLSRIR